MSPEARGKWTLSEVAYTASWFALVFMPWAFLGWYLAGGLYASPIGQVVAAVLFGVTGLAALAAIVLGLPALVVQDGGSKGRALWAVAVGVGIIIAFWAWLASFENVRL